MSMNLYSSSTAASFSSMAKAMGQKYGLSVESSMLLISGGNTQDTMDQIGRELGINDEKGEQNLSYNRYVNSADDVNNNLFGGNDGILYNVNWTNGTISSQSAVDFAKDNGMITEEGKMYDILEFGHNEANFTEYKFDGLDDGKANTYSTSLNVFGNYTWSNMNHKIQEVDCTTWLSGEATEIGKISRRAFSNILNNMDQWISSLDKEDLYDSATEEEFYEKAAEYAVEYLDQSGKTYDEYVNGLPVDDPADDETATNNTNTTNTTNNTTAADTADIEDIEDKADTAAKKAADSLAAIQE